MVWKENIILTLNYYIYQLIGGKRYEEMDLAADVRTALCRVYSCGRDEWGL